MLLHDENNQQTKIKLKDKYLFKIYGLELDLQDGKKTQYIVGHFDLELVKDATICTSRFVGIQQGKNNVSRLCRSPKQ